MEPRTQRQKEAVAIRDSLKPITEREIAIGYRKAFWYSGTQYQSGRCVCRECGHEWERTTHMWRICKDRDAKMLNNIGRTKKRPLHELKPGANHEITICPNCRKKLHAYPNGKQTHGEDQAYFSVLEHSGKYQIIRTFEVIRHWRHGEPASYEFCGEVSQRYIDMEKGDLACDLAKTVNGLKGMYSSFTYWKQDSEMSVKYSASYSGYSGYSHEKYNFACMYIIRSLHPILKRAQYQHIQWAKADYMTALKDPHAATLVEAKQLALFELYNHGGGSAYWPQMKICIRNGYKVTDETLWRDTISNLRYLGMDDHSPKYICPDNLKQLHDQTQRRRDRIEAERRRREAAEEDRRSEAAYAKYIKRYRSIELKGRGITIYPLPSVAAFFEEGEAMRHCVYSNGYYKDRTILILSARNDKGDRLATIEYALKTGKIRQCRSKCNGIPERDADIRELITNNRKVFTKAMTAAN